MSNFFLVLSLQYFEKVFVCGKGKKVKLSLCLTKHHAMKAYWGSGV
jgi:hypothetical protein